MYHYSDGNVRRDCSNALSFHRASAGATEEPTNQTLSEQNYESFEYGSPVIPQIMSQNLRPNFVFHPGNIFATAVQRDPAQERIDKSHWICDYSDDIYQTLRESELKRRLVCFRSQQVEYRPRLLKLLRVATEKHKLTRSTLHLAVYLLDCFMDSYTIWFEKLKLAAITCLIVAAKIEESDSDMPKFADLNELVEKPYLLLEFKSMERKVLGTFNFDLIRPTAATFAEYFANSLVTLQDYHVYLKHWNNDVTLNHYHNYHQEHNRHQESEYQTNENANDWSTLRPLINTMCPYSSYDDMLATLSKIFFTLIDVSLNYLKFANARPSVIASACIAVVRQMNGIFPIWTPYLIKLTECTAEIISPFVEAVVAIYRLYCHNGSSAHVNTPKTPTSEIYDSTNSSNILCDSPDSGVVLDNDTKSLTSDDEANKSDVLTGKVGDDTDEEDEPYNCLEYPLLPKRRRIV